MPRGSGSKRRSSISSATRSGPAREALRALAELATPAASASAAPTSSRSLEALLERGDGAHEQRAAYDAAGGSLLGVAQWLAERTTTLNGLLTGRRALR